MTANVTTVPADILNGVASILKPYGVDIVAILAQQENNPSPPIVETLRKKYLTCDEATRYCGVRRWTLWKAEREGKIKASKISDSANSRVLYDRDSIDAWLESRTKKPGRKPLAN